MKSFYHYLITRINCKKSKVFPNIPRKLCHHIDIISFMYYCNKKNEVEGRIKLFTLFLKIHSIIFLISTYH